VLHDLLPLEAEAPRCSDFARSIELLPPGTGLHLQRVILVSVPLPWPKPALGHHWLTGAMPFVNQSSISSRVFAMEPIGQDVNLEVYERTPTGAERHQWWIQAPEHIPRALSVIAATGIGDLQHLKVEHAVLRSSGTSPATFLICTQGSHDLCCGDSGVRFADQIVRERPSCAVRRVSHTGGHRFSPTLLAFPEGRMWAFADLDLADRILTNTVSATDYRTRCRGWWGAKVGPAQVAETAVRCELAPSSDSCDSTTTVDLIADAAEVKEYYVTVGSRKWRVHVTIGRQVPSIACESPGGLPAKPGREYSWHTSYEGDK